MRWFFIPCLLLSCPLLGQEQVEDEFAPSPSRSGVELSQSIDAIWKKETSFPVKWGELEDFVWSLSIEEIKAYFALDGEEYSGEFEELLLKRWGYLDPEELILQFHKNDRKAQELDDWAGMGLEGNSAEAQLSYEWSRFNAMMAGWSEKDPKAAWNATKKPDGRVAHLTLFHCGFGYLTPIKIFRNLAKVDADFAWAEFRDFPDREYRDLWRESILRGIASGLPDDTDWDKALNLAVEYSREDVDTLKDVIREQLLSRWVSIDYVRAKRWFESEKASSIAYDESYLSFDSSAARFFFGQQVDPDHKLMVRASMRPAIVRWMSRDFEGALVFLRERKELVQQLLEKNYSSLDEFVSAQNIRQMMVSCFPQKEREAVLKRMLETDEDTFRNPLGIFCSVGKKEEMRKSLAELDVPEDLIEEVIENIRAGYILDDDE